MSCFFFYFFFYNLIFRITIGVVDGLRFFELLPLLLELLDFLHNDLLRVLQLGAVIPQLRLRHLRLEQRRVRPLIIIVLSELGTLSEF